MLFWIDFSGSCIYLVLLSSNFKLPDIFNCSSYRSYIASITSFTIFQFLTPDMAFQLCLLFGATCSVSRNLWPAKFYAAAPAIHQMVIPSIFRYLSFIYRT